jgi:hypothetical protein
MVKNSGHFFDIEQYISFSYIYILREGLFDTRLFFNSSYVNFSSNLKISHGHSVVFNFSKSQTLTYFIVYIHVKLWYIYILQFTCIYMVNYVYTCNFYC